MCRSFRKADEANDVWPHAAPNYLSAETDENATVLKQQFDEDVQAGMMFGPFLSSDEVAAYLGCNGGDLVYGALAVRDEVGGKKRGLQDGTVVDVNDLIRAHIHRKGSCPARGGLEPAKAVDALEEVEKRSSKRTHARHAAAARPCPRIPVTRWRYVPCTLRTITPTDDKRQVVTNCLEPIVDGELISMDAAKCGVAQTRWIAQNVHHLAVYLQPLHAWSAALEGASKPDVLHRGVAELAIALLNSPIFACLLSDSFYW